MPRPFSKRVVAGMPQCVHFKPAGVPLRFMEEVPLRVDELEAMRLADLEGLYQEDAAKQMGVSRQTFGRILESAHKKVADCFVNGKAIRIEGGNVEVMLTPPPPCGRGRGHGCRHGQGGRGRWQV